MEYVNQAYLEFLGVESHEVLGNAWTYFLHPEDRNGTPRLRSGRQGPRCRSSTNSASAARMASTGWMIGGRPAAVRARGKFAGYTGAFFDIRR